MEITNQKQIRDNNLKRLFLNIRMEDGISRAELARRVHLSKVTVSALVEELIERNFLWDSGTEDFGEGGPGRVPNRLHIRKGVYFFFCVEWYEYFIRISLEDIAGLTMVRENIQVSGDAPDYIGLSRKAVLNILSVYSLTWSNVLAICFILPGMIDARNRQFYSRRLRIPEKLQNELPSVLADTFDQSTLALFNDTACYAYAEKTISGGSGDDMAFFNFSDGIGATLIIDGRMTGNAGGCMTQAGQMPILHQSDGSIRTLEEEIGEAFLKERLSEADPGSPLLENERLTYIDLHQAARHGNQGAAAMIRTMADSFSLVLANVISLIGIRRIVLGGRAANLGEEFIDEVVRALKVYGFSKMTEGAVISYSNLRETSAAIGAVRYYFDEYFHFFNEQERRLILG